MNKYSFRRILAMLLITVMVANIMPVGAFADTAAEQTEAVQEEPSGEPGGAGAVSSGNADDAQLPKDDSTMLTDNTFGQPDDENEHLDAGSDSTANPVFNVGGYRVFYHAEGGRGSVTDEKEYAAGQAAVIKPDIDGHGVGISRDGYRFVGWTIASGFDVVTHYPGSFATLNEDLHLYAVWVLSSDQYRVFYFSNGGEGSVNDGNLYPEGEAAVIKDATDMTDGGTGIYREGCNFLGWSTDIDSAFGTHNPGDSFDLYEDLHLYAIWELQSHRVFYDANGGEGFVNDNHIYYHGEEVMLKAVTDATDGGTGLYRDGYVFTGWSVDPYSTFATHYPGLPYTIYDDLYLYAIWEWAPATYQITYHAQGGEGTVIDGNKYMYGAEATIKANTDITDGGTGIKRDGYRFLGWSLIYGSEIVTNDPGTPITIIGDLDLYAVWVCESAEFNVTAQKKLEGAAISGYEGAFEFIMEGPDGTRYHTFNDIDGRIVFHNILLEAVSEGESYTYTIREAAGTNSKITYDSTEYLVVVEVVAAGSGLSGIIREVWTNGEKADNLEIVFTNTYNSGTVTPPKETKPGSDSKPGPDVTTEPTTEIKIPELPAPLEPGDTLIPGEDNGSLADSVDGKAGSSVGSVPKTGDDNNLFIWMAAVFAPLGLIAVLLTNSRRKKDQQNVSE